MATIHDKVSHTTQQIPPVVGELERIFEALPDTDFLKALTPKRRFGRPSYPAKILWRSYLVRYALGLNSVSALIRTLQDNPFIAATCGIDSPDTIPSQPTYSRFMTRLSRRNVAVLVKDVMREMTREFYRTLPDFGGGGVAIDSTDVRAWSNKAKKPATDRDASWAVKSSTGDIRRYWLGYKLHLAVDTRYEIPLAAVITSANVHDTRGATRVLSEARFTNGAFHPDYVTADAGYSSDKLRQHIRRQYRSEAVIKANPRHKKALALETPAFRLTYNTRVSVERCFSRLKEHRSLNTVTVRGVRKVAIHVCLSLIVLQAQALATGCRASVRKVA